MKQRQNAAWKPGLRHFLDIPEGFFTLPAVKHASELIAGVGRRVASRLASCRWEPSSPRPNQ